jgi:hypothetical protein
MREDAAYQRTKLSCRLRRMLTEYPQTRAFTVHKVIHALGVKSAGPPLALFSAAGAFELPEAAALSEGVISALGAGWRLVAERSRYPERYSNAKFRGIRLRF